MTNYVLAQIIGFIAVCFTFALFQVNNRRSMLAIGLVGGTLYAAHFILLGALTGAALNVVNIAKAGIFYKYNEKRRPNWLPYLFIGLTILSGIATWQGFRTLLPVIAGCAATIAFWQLDTKRIRRLALIAPPCWFVYNVIVGSYPGMLSEIVNVSSNSLAQYRFDRKKPQRSYSAAEVRAS
jgi:D-alanyl-lipoteichoic acid acyltransferase DltB (MBOAT superfamily)